MTDPTSLPDFPPSPDQQPLRGRVLDALLDEGFRPDIDQDGDVAVKVQGQQLYVRCIEGDDITILRIFGQWRLADAVEPDELARLRACNDVTARLQVGKTVLAEDMLISSAEHVVTPGTPLRGLLTTSLELVLTAVNLWHEALGRAVSRQEEQDRAVAAQQQAQQQAQDRARREAAEESDEDLRRRRGAQQQRDQGLLP